LSRDPPLNRLSLLSRTSSTFSSNVLSLQKTGKTCVQHSFRNFLQKDVPPPVTHWNHGIPTLYIVEVPLFFLMRRPFLSQNTFFPDTFQPQVSSPKMKCFPIPPTTSPVLFVQKSHVLIAPYLLVFSKNSRDRTPQPHPQTQTPPQHPPNNQPPHPPPPPPPPPTPHRIPKLLRYPNINPLYYVHPVMLLECLSFSDLSSEELGPPCPRSSFPWIFSPQRREVPLSPSRRFP